MTGILGTVGDTPLVRLDRLLDRRDLALYAKLELANPGGSAKDRPATRMLEQAMADGLVDSDTLVVESSSGNTGIGLAQFCRYHQLRFRCVVDPRTQPQNLAILRAYGAEIDCVDYPDARTGDFLIARLRRVAEILEAVPNSFWPDQYANPQNPRAHELGTMREIDQALGGELDYLFVAVSSTGTATGCRDYLRRHGRSTRVIAVDAVGSVLFGGERGRRSIPGLGAGTEPPLARDLALDRLVRVSDLDCVVGVRKLMQREAILAGGSSGGVVEAACRLAPTLPSGSVCAVLLADDGTRYLDTLFDDDWVAAHIDCSPLELARALARCGLESPQRAAGPRRIPATGPASPTASRPTPDRPPIGRTAALGSR